jgi:hypothetical protein
MGKTTKKWEPVRHTYKYDPPKTESLKEKWERVMGKSVIGTAIHRLKRPSISVHFDTVLWRRPHQSKDDHRHCSDGHLTNHKRCLENRKYRLDLR